MLFCSNPYFLLLDAAFLTHYSELVDGNQDYNKLNALLALYNVEWWFMPIVKQGLVFEKA